MPLGEIMDIVYAQYINTNLLVIVNLLFLSFLFK